MYNYKDSKANIINILKSKTPIEKKESIPNDKNFTYKNGIKSFVSAIFVDIKNSSELFKTQDEKLARLLRAFTSEIITIFQGFDKYNQIGIRGDCVYAIYSTPTKKDIDAVFDLAIRVNTFMYMFNLLLKESKYGTIGVGIGLGSGEELIIKAGRTGTGINDKIWIGSAVVDAANLSSIANRNGYRKIAMNSCFYSNIKDLKQNKNLNFLKTSHTDLTEDFFQCDITEADFKKWIDAGMRDGK